MTADPGLPSRQSACFTGGMTNDTTPAIDLYLAIARLEAEGLGQVECVAPGCWTVRLNTGFVHTLRFDDEGLAAFVANVVRETDRELALR